MLFKLKRVVVFIIYILSIAIFQIPTANALVSEADIIAVDTGGVFYKQGCTPNESTDAGFAGNNNVETAFNFFNGRQGISAAQSAGIVGNFMRESGPELNTSALNLDGSASFGIAQWLGGRKAGLINYARSQGKEATDIMVQLDYVMVELNGGYNKSVLVPLLKTTTPEEAAILWENKYEISKDEVGDAGMAKRINYANDVFKLYGNNSPGSTPLSNCPAAPGAGSGTTGPVGDIGLSSDSVACPDGTVDLGVANSKYTGSAKTEPGVLKIRLCQISEIPGRGNDASGAGTNSGAVVNSRVAGAWLALARQAKIDNIPLTSSSSFRLADSCGGTGDGSRCAKPGTSPHQLGIAIDFANMNLLGSSTSSCTGRARLPGNIGWDWLFKNAEKWGVEQYSYEAWHWDLLGVGNRCNSSE